MQIEIRASGEYAAIRPQKGVTAAYSHGAVTNYLENGHVIRSPTAYSKSYHPRLQAADVSGYHFYETVLSQAEGRFVELANDWTEQIGNILEGKK